jgi:hypothetical protein
MHKEKKTQKRKNGKNQAQKMQSRIHSHFSNKDTLVEIDLLLLRKYNMETISLLFTNLIKSLVLC